MRSAVFPALRSGYCTLTILLTAQDLVCVEISRYSKTLHWAMYVYYDYQERFSFSVERKISLRSRHKSNIKPSSAMLFCLQTQAIASFTHFCVKMS